MLRASLVIFSLMLLFGGAVPRQAAAQANFDRPGGDYKHFKVQSGDPADCALSCERDRLCRAWSFSYPKDKGGAVCWLKSTVPARTANNCCVTGVRGAGVVERRTRSVESSIDRIGGDLRSFELKAGQGEDTCRKACDDDNKCRAWTFARAGYLGPEARCYLKSQIKPPRRSPCCTSGVVR